MNSDLYQRMFKMNKIPLGGSTENRVRNLLGMSIYGGLGSLVNLLGLKSRQRVVNFRCYYIYCVSTVK